MSALLDNLRAKYPHYKIINEPDTECGCKGLGERRIKPSELFPVGRDTPCLCICLSGNGRADTVKVFGIAAAKVLSDLKNEW